MKKKLTFKNIILFLVFLLIVFQFFRIDKTKKISSPGLDILTITQANETIGSLLKNSCYDCHSNEITYPWYTNVAPISWWIRHHVNEGTHHLNFSEWGNYPTRKADHKLKECVEMLEENEMPLTSYTLIHGNAKLNGNQRKILIDWFNSLRTHESDKPKKE